MIFSVWFWPSTHSTKQPMVRDLPWRGGRFTTSTSSRET